MGRPNEGWRLKRTPGSSTWSVIWTQPPAEGQTRGIEIQRSTGQRDPRRAEKVAAQLYAAAIRTGEVPGSAPATRRPKDSLERLAEQWLTARTDLDSQTKATYALYFETHLAPYFGTLVSVSPESVKAYSAKRLAIVGASTVRHELSCLRMLIRWALPNENVDILVPSLPKSARGTSYEKSTGLRRRGKPTELTEQETISIISKLPWLSRTPRNRPESERYPIKARFIVKYETGLREALLDQLSIPEHWDPGTPAELRITPDLDKMRYGRTVVLTQAAQTALQSVVQSQGVGLLFGSHDYRSAVRTAARAAGIPEHRVVKLAPNDLRHARATHLGSKPEANLNAMMFMFGWTQPQTAARYMHPDKEAMRTMLSFAQTVSEPSATPTSSPIDPSPASANQSGSSTSGARGSASSSTTSKDVAAKPGGSSIHIGKLSSDDEPFGFG